MEATDISRYDPEELVMLIDVDRCISCGACALACRLEHGDGRGRPGRIRPIRVGLEKDAGPKLTLNLPSSCRHCSRPCEYYNAYNFWTTCPDTKKPDPETAACNFCIRRVEKGFMAACATRCSMKAIHFGKAGDVALALGEKRLCEMGDAALGA